MTTRKMGALSSLIETLYAYAYLGHIQIQRLRVQKLKPYDSEHVHTTLPRILIQQISEPCQFGPSRYFHSAFSLFGPRHQDMCNVLTAAKV